MSQRRRFSVFQRNHRVTVGPLGLDVPLPNDTTAFPSEDEVDEEDRLSDVDYSVKGSDAERAAKRRRIHTYARDYLIGRRLDIYAAALRGPIKENYWGEEAKVEGTALELKALELKQAHMDNQRDTKKRQAKKHVTPGNSQGKLTAAFRAAKTSAFTTKSSKSSPAVDSPPLTKLILSSFGPEETRYTVDDSQTNQIVDITSPESPKQESEPEVPANVVDKTPTVGATFESLVVPDTDFADKVARVANAVLESEKPTVNEDQNPQERPVDPREVVETTKEISPVEAPPQAPDIEAPLPTDRKEMANLEASNKNEGMGEQAPINNKVREPFVVGFDSESYEKINAMLEVDGDSVSGPKDAIGALGNTESPATVLKASLPKFGSNPKPSTAHKDPPSPTENVFLRKAIRPVNHHRRNDLGNAKSLKEVIAMTSGAKMKRPSMKTKRRSSVDSSKQAEPIPPKEGTVSNSARPAIETGPALAINPGKESAVKDAVVVSPQNTESAAPNPAIPDLPVEQIVSVHHIEINATDSKASETSNVASNELSITQPPQSVRLSQMPTPLPPSPLTLVTAPQQAMPVVDEPVTKPSSEKPLPTDTSLKENEPVLIPGPRRAKRTAPKPRPSVPADAQPSSNEELRAAIVANRTNVPTPISKLQKKIAEFSPVSPMTARPISPIPESTTKIAPKTVNKTLLDKLSGERENSPAQLSSPPTSTPVRVETIAVIQTEETTSINNDMAVSKKSSSTSVNTSAETLADVFLAAPPTLLNDLACSKETIADEDSTIEMSSGQYRRIEESIRSMPSISLPPARNDISVTHVSASEPETQLASTDVSATSSSVDAEAQPSPQKTPPPISLAAAQEPVDTETQNSHVSVPDSFKRAIAAPIDYNFQTPGAPLPPPFVPSTSSGFTPINAKRISKTIQEPTTPTRKGTARPFTSPPRAIEFTPFNTLSSPIQSTRTSQKGTSGDVSMHEPTTLVSPFTFSQMMKPMNSGESQNLVSRFEETRQGSNGDKETQSSYDLENILGGVEDYLMSDVYDVEEEARRLTADRSFGGH